MQKPSFYSMVEAINFLKVEEGNKFLKVKGPEQSKIRIQFRKNSQAMDKWTPPRTKFEPNDRVNVSLCASIYWPPQVPRQ